MPGSGFGRVYRILQHRGLAGVETGRETRVTVRVRIISDPEINTTVSGQKYAVAGNETVVHPTGRCTGSSAKEKENEGAHASPELGMSGNRRFEQDCAR